MTQTQDFQGNFTYRPNPFLERSFLICRKERSGDVVPVGDYTVLDAAEDMRLSERKVINLVMRLNGEKKLVPLGEQTRSRMLFHIKPRQRMTHGRRLCFIPNPAKGYRKKMPF